MLIKKVNQRHDQLLTVSMILVVMNGPPVALKPPSSCFYGRVTWDDLNLDLTDLLEVQSEPEQEKAPSQCWSDMAKEEMSVFIEGRKEERKRVRKIVRLFVLSNF
jgi:hypothetical protein